MKLETTIENEEARDLLDANAVTTPEHDAWMTAQIEATVEEYKAGVLTFRTLDDVMADFGFDAR